MPTRLVRWWLLAGLLVAGVALMHTLGHPATGPAMPGHPATGPAMPGHPATGAAMPGHGSGGTSPGSRTFADRPGAAVGLFAGSRPVGVPSRPVPDGAVTAATAWPSLDTPGPRPHGMDPRLVCLAVLATLLVAVGAVARRMCRRAAGSPAAVPLPAGTPARGPPVRRAIGRTLATQSVLRI